MKKTCFSPLFIILFLSLLTINAKGVTTTGTFTPIAPDNQPPVISSPYPSNGSIIVPLNVTCYITVNDLDGDTMNLSFWENTTGNWTLIQTNNSISNGTYYWTYDNASNYSTKYYWNVSLNDGHNYTNATYYFTTRDSPSVPSEPSEPGGGGTGLFIPVEILVKDLVGNPVSSNEVFIYQNGLLLTISVTNADGIAKFMLIQGKYEAKTTLGNETRKTDLDVRADKSNKYLISFKKPDYLFKIGWTEFLILVLIFSIVIILAGYRSRRISKVLKKIRDKYFIKFKRKKV